MTADGGISLRPLSLRPGGAAKNPFAGFAQGAGVGLKNRVSSLSPAARPPMLEQAPMVLVMVVAACRGRVGPCLLPAPPRSRAPSGSRMTRRSRCPKWFVTRGTS
jgi:hypothetical protein